MSISWTSALHRDAVVNCWAGSGEKKRLRHTDKALRQTSCIMMSCSLCTSAKTWLGFSVRWHDRFFFSTWRLEWERSCSNQLPSEILKIKTLQIQFYHTGNFSHLETQSVFPLSPRFKAGRYFNRKRRQPEYLRKVWRKTLLAQPGLSRFSGHSHATNIQSLLFQYTDNKSH